LTGAAGTIWNAKTADRVLVEIIAILLSVFIASPSQDFDSRA
jgi:hypothetical protein